MRDLILLRGVPGSGKSTWLKEMSKEVDVEFDGRYNLQDYVVSADTIRKMYSAPQTKTDDSLRVNGDNDKFVWQTLYQVVEQRMKNGDLTIIDNTNINERTTQRYKQFAKQYRYRLYVVNVDTQLDVCLENNKLRKGTCSYVPEDVIEMFYERLKKSKLSKSFVEINRESFMDILRKENFLNANEYKKIVTFGDIHGCFEPLREYFRDSPMRDDYLYIFVGDYFDRGTQTVEVFNFLYPLLKNKNVILLEGNHEPYLKHYVHDNNGHVPYGYKISTKVQFTKANIDKKKVSLFYQRLRQCVTLEYHGNMYYINHGGYTSIPNGFTSTCELINGVGKYEDQETVANSWNERTASNQFQIHGHRNSFLSDIQNGRNFNLCDVVELGGFFRVLEIDENKKIKKIKIKNNNFMKCLFPCKEGQIDISDIHYSLIPFRKDKDINLKDLGNNICSVNFTKEAFQNRNWNERTNKARGLFLNYKTGKIVARSYDKFFNYEEDIETPFSFSNTPIQMFKKYNGFLGILSVYEDKFFVASKRTIFSDHAINFREQLERDGLLTDKLKDYMKKENISLMFEVCDIDFDPHIIDEGKKIVLLDSIKNEFGERPLPYTKLLEISKEFNFTVKEMIPSPIKEDVDKDILALQNTARDSHGKYIEGYVFNDSKGGMLKIKTNFYKFWKTCRFFKESIELGRKRFTVKTPEEQYVLDFLNTFTVDELLKMSIIDVRNLFEKQDGM